VVRRGWHWEEGHGRGNVVVAGVRLLRCLLATLGASAHRNDTGGSVATSARNNGRGMARRVSDAPIWQLPWVQPLLSVTACISP